MDYKQLNDLTVKDSFALPRTEEIFDCLYGAQYVTTMDMKSGYHQIEVEESSHIPANNTGHLGSKVARPLTELLPPTSARKGQNKTQVPCR